MEIWNFKQESMLNSAWVRVLNCIIAVPLALIYSSDGSLHISINLAVLLYAIFSTALSINYILSQNKWFEFDKEEMRRKESFMLIYSCISFVLATIIGAVVMGCLESIDNGEPCGLYLALVIFLLFNKVNICSLYNFGNSIQYLFSQYDCDINKLSNNEIAKIEKDVMKYILRKDYNIDLDELQYELRRYKGLED